MAVSATAQSGKLLRANKMFKELNYQGAITLYESILKKSPEPIALFNLATCYRKVGDTRNAEYWYGRAITHPDATTDMYFYYGLMLLSNEKIDEAKTQFNKFIEKEPGQARGYNLLAACNDTLRQELMNAGILYQIQNIERINSKYDDFGPVMYTNGASKGVLFCSERDTSGAANRKSAWTGRSFVDMYYAKYFLIDEDKQEYKYGKAEEFSEDLYSKFHDGPASFQIEKDEIYFTRNHKQRDENGISNLGIYKASKKDGRWTNIESIAINNPAYTVAHPAITPDGYKMYFSSDMDGGFGGMDLYVSYWESDRWGSPLNLGPEINTEGDEIFPFVDHEGILYFASDGHTGLGGLDVYSSTVYRGVWAPVTNLGFPINSNKDDFGITMDSTKTLGYFSSNRDGGQGLTDIYSFTRLTVDVELLVFDKNTGLGIPNLKVKTPCFPRDSFVTNADGKIFTEMPIDRNCVFTVYSDTYGNIPTDISTQNYQVNTTLFFEVPLDAGDLEFSVTGSVRDRSGQPVNNATVLLLSSCGTDVKSTTTNATGDYEFELEEGCCYVAQVSKEGFFTSIDTFCTKGETQSLAFESSITMPKFWDEDMINAMDTSSLYIIDNIYYATGAYKVDPSSPGLGDLLNLLENNPEKLYKLATRGMLPKTKLGKKMLMKLKVYAGAEHPHTAQIAK